MVVPVCRLLHTLFLASTHNRSVESKNIEAAAHIGLLRSIVLSIGLFKLFADIFRYTWKKMSEMFLL